MHSLKFYIIENLWIFISIIAGINAAITQGPSNTASEIGKQIKLNCTADTSIGYWLLSKNGDTNGELTIVGPGCGAVNAPFGDHYDVESSGGGAICNLIVFDITMEQAGVYKCVQGTTASASILTVIIESSPVNTVNSTTAVVENESVMSECSVSYNGSMPPAPTLRPYFYWTNSSGQNVSSYYDSTTENKAVSRLAVTAARENITSYTCHVYLQLQPAATVGYANNTPTVDMSDSSPTIEVLYPPLISTISSEGRNDSTSSCEISSVTCHATAHPTANYTWIDIEEPSKIIYGQSFGYAEFGRNYNCSATNIIITNTNTDVKNHEERNEYSTIPPCKFPRATSMSIYGQSCNEDTCTCECSPATILCHVDAYPRPSYEWLLPDGSRVEGQTVEAMISGIFVCKTYALIDGYLVEAYKSINVSGCYFSLTTATTSDSTENHPQSTNSSVEAAAIVLGVLLAISITFNIICLLLFYRKGVLKRSDSSEATKPNSNSEEPHYQDLFKETSTITPEYEELRH